MTLAELRALAIANLTCRACKVTPTNRCVGPAGFKVAAHKERVDDIRAWLLGAASRDAEVTNLSRQAAVLSSQLGDEQGRNEVLEQNASTLAGQLSDARDATRAAEINLSDLRLEFDAYKASHPDDPEPTRMLIGAGGGNSDRTKQDIDIDRPYYGGSDADLAKFEATARRNHAAGILTWATFKLPVSWASAATGGADAWFDRLTTKARALGFEVWIDLHHEPEGDGDGKLWRQFQGRLANRLGDGATGPVKFLLCMTGYSEEYGSDPATKWDTYWPSEAADKIYAIAYDNPYLRYGVPLAGGALDTTWSEGANSYVKKLAARAKSLGVKAAIGEFGYSDEAFAKDPAWLDRTLAACAGEGLVAVVYFDSILNSTRSWALGGAGSAKRTWFELAAAANR